MCYRCSINHNNDFIVKLENMKKSITIETQMPSTTTVNTSNATTLPNEDTLPQDTINDNNDIIPVNRNQNQSPTKSSTYSSFRE